MEACGVTAGWGENIAYGYATADAVMQGWLNSPGHRANIERSTYRAIGVGAATGSNSRIYWAQVFSTSTSGGSTPPPPPSGGVTVFPSALTVNAGTPLAGGPSSLAADDGRTLGTTETETVATVTGALASYVSGSTGNGDVAVRVGLRRQLLHELHDELRAAEDHLQIGRTDVTEGRKPAPHARLNS